MCGAVHCYECGERGHVSAQYPSRMLYSTEGAVEKKRKTLVVGCNAVCWSRYVNDKMVEDILLDTGCAQMLVHGKFVPPGRENGDGSIVQCDEVSYPTTEVNIVIDKKKCFLLW